MAGTTSLPCNNPTRYSGTDAFAAAAALPLQAGSPTAAHGTISIMSAARQKSPIAKVRLLYLLI
jgi:hypothetical protein